MPKSSQYNTLLWSATPVEGGPVSYLFGTMHVRDERAFHLLAPVYRYIDECEALALEFDLDEAGAGLDPAMLQLPEGQTLEGLLGAPKFDKLRSFLLRALGIDLRMFQRVLPMMTINAINEQLMSKDRPLALDEQLWQYAKEQGKSIVGIETYREQLEVLQSISVEMQLQALLWMGRSLSRHRRHLRKMADLYEAGDIYRLHRASKRSASGMRHTLLYRRNAIMAERIGQLIRQRAAVCAVGAGHLAGGKGVLRLLKYKGFRLRPVELR